MTAVDERLKWIVALGISSIVGLQLGSRAYVAIRESVNAFDPTFGHLIWIGLLATIVGVFLWFLSLKARRLFFLSILLGVVSFTSITMGAMLTSDILIASSVINRP